MDKRELHKSKRKMAIMNCCLDMFITRGYDATGIRDIAKELDMGIGVFFNYFDSKEKVYNELIKEAIISQKYIEVIFQSKLEPITVFEQIAVSVFDVFEKNPTSFKLFKLILLAVHINSLPESIKSSVNHYDMITPLASIIVAGQQKGQIKSGDPIALSNTFWGAIEGISMNMVLSPQMPPPKSEWLVDIVKL